MTKDTNPVIILKYIYNYDRRYMVTEIFKVPIIKEFKKYAVFKTSKIHLIQTGI